LTDKGDVTVPETIYSGPASLPHTAVLGIAPIGPVQTTFTSKDALRLLEDQEMLGTLNSGLRNGLVDVTSAEAERGLITDYVYRPIKQDGSAGEPVISGRPAVIVLVRDVPWQGLPTGRPTDVGKEQVLPPYYPNSDVVIAFDASSGELLFLRTVAHN
jgi:hypothetical protein